MPLFLTSIISFIGSLFVSGAATTAKFITFRIGLIVLITGLIAAAIVAFVEQVFDVIQILLPMVTTLDFVPYFLPSNLDTCIGAHISIELAAVIYKQVSRFIAFKASILSGANGTTRI